MVKFLFRRCLQSNWLEPAEEDIGVVDAGPPNLGVMLRRPDGIYTAEPMFINQDVVKAVERLGVAVAFTMSSEITHALLQQITPFQTELTLDPRGFTLPIVNSAKDLTSRTSPITKDAYICLCRSEKLVLVWGDSVKGILAHGTDIETRLLGLVRNAPVLYLETKLLTISQVWGSHISNPGMTTPYRISGSPANRQSIFPTGASGLSGPGDAVTNEKISVIQTAIELEEQGDKAFDPETEGQEAPPRPFLLTHAIIIGLAMILVVVVEMACIAKVRSQNSTQ
jgi:hypothetical protein